MAFHLEREFILEYCRIRALIGIADFLKYIITSEGFSDFSAYLQHTVKLPIKSVGGGILFHGSLKPLDFLTCAKSAVEKHIYATNNANYAIFLSVTDIQEGGAASVHVSKNEFSITAGFINGESKISKGFVHIVSEDGFRATSNSEYVCEGTIPVLFSMPVCFEDLTEKVFVKS